MCKKIVFIIIFYTMTISLSFTQGVYTDSTKIKNPSIAWKMAFIPGMGQMYNKKWVKSLILLSSEYYVIDKYKYLKKTGNITKRNTYAWWIIGIYIYGILDAYVDAHLSSFPLLNKNEEMSNNDDNFK